MPYIVGECYTFGADQPEGESAWLFMPYGWVRVA
jgi:hypothetical protein